MFFSVSGPGDPRRPVPGGHAGVQPTDWGAGGHLSAEMWTTVGSRAARHAAAQDTTGKFPLPSLRPLDVSTGFFVTKIRIVLNFLWNTLSIRFDTVLENLIPGMLSVPEIPLQLTQCWMNLPVNWCNWVNALIYMYSFNVIFYPSAALWSTCTRSTWSFIPQPRSDLHVPVQRDLVGAGDDGGVPHVPLHWRHLRWHPVALLGLTVAKEQNLLHTQKVSRRIQLQTFNEKMEEFVSSVALSPWNGAIYYSTARKLFLLLV